MGPSHAPGAPELRIGEYVVGDRLGEGGMGAVYRVVHAPTGAVRAMKVLRNVDRTTALRFQREAEAMAAVGGHEHLLKVHTAGHEPGFAYFVMDLATGGDLADRLRAGRLAPEEVVRVGAGVARGLAHLHAHGLVHRDIKPSNIFLDERGAPLLADLGLVRRLDDSQTRLTETGIILGTPAYMAPEQVTGADELDARTDVYALGMVLYEAATGRYPYDAQSGALDLLARIARQTPSSPRELVPDLPPALDAVIMRCLEKQPDRRFASALEVAAQLEAALLPPAEPAPRTGRRAALALAAVLACAGVGLGAAALSAPAPTASSAATAPAPATEGAPPLDPVALAREVEGLLAREDLVAAARALDGVPSRDAGRVPAAALCAALVAADDPALDEAWRARASGRPALLEAVRDAERLRGALSGRAEEAAASLVRGGVGVARAATLAREAVSRWRAESYGKHPDPALPCYERLVAAAADCAPEGPGLALRLLVQREVLAFDSALLRLANRARPEQAERLARVLAAARALAPETRAARALEVVERWAASRRGQADPAAAPLATPLEGRYAPQEVVRHALDVIQPGGSADLGELDARLAAWRRAWSAAQALGLVDDQGVLAREVSYDAATRLELLLAAQERRVWALTRRAFLLRGGPDEAACWDEALGAAAALDDYRGEDAEPLVVVHLARGDVASARAALRRVEREPRRSQLDLELALLEGDLDRARGLVDRLGDGQLPRCQRALVAALDGQDVTSAVADLRRAAAELPFMPWRGVDTTAHAISAARSGWRPWTARRPWP